MTWHSKKQGTSQDNYIKKENKMSQQQGQRENNGMGKKKKTLLVKYRVVMSFVF